MAFLIVMGPCGCGKSVIGVELSKLYNCPFIDADDLHGPENVSKMQNGIPLTDEDRIPWLMRVRESLLGNSSKQTTFKAVSACSALKLKYRNIIRTGNADEAINFIPQEKEKAKFIFIFINCSKLILEQRLAKRANHFMKPRMLESQLSILEPPNQITESDSIEINGDLTLPLILDEISGKLFKKI